MFEKDYDKNDLVPIVTRFFKGLLITVAIVALTTILLGLLFVSI